MACIPVGYTNRRQYSAAAHTISMLHKSFQIRQRSGYAITKPFDSHTRWCLLLLTNYIGQKIEMDFVFKGVQL